MKRFVPVVSSLVSCALLAFSTVPAYATSDHNPAGNNGFVKINNEVAPDDIPQNHPHVSCDFSVEFYNYDKNNTSANVSFELQAPTNRSGDSLKVTSGNLHPFIGEDAASGGNDLDAREHYTLAFTGTPQANQGFHVKLTVDAPGSKGSGKKSKVFWVQPCAATTPVATTTTTTPGTTTSPQILGTSTTTPASLPNTGTSLTSTLSLAGLVAAGGYLFTLWRQKRAARQF